MSQVRNEIKLNFRKDFSGGLLAAIIGLPMALAFGVQSGLGAEAGIYTAIILALVAAIFGGTNTLISDPTGPMTVVAATVVSMAVTSSGNVEDAIPIILGTFVLAGLFELIFGLLDLGKFVKYMPYPVVSSFMTGIGLIIISMQIYPFLGHSSPKGIFNIMSDLESTIFDCNLSALSLGVLALFIIYLFPLLSKKVPSVLVALVLCTVVSVIFGLEVPSIGAIPTQLPSMQLSELSSLSWSDINIMLAPAIMIGGLGVIDSLLTSVVADNLTDTKHHSRRTIIGQGIGNILASLFGGIPGAGATVGTVTNINAGGVTRASGFYKGIILLVIILGVADYVALVPMSVLASVLIFTGLSIIDFKGIKMLFSIPRADALVWFIVLLFTIFNNLLNAVAAGFVLACFLFIAQVINSMKFAHNQQSLDQLDDSVDIPKEVAQSIIVQNLDGPLFFGFADHYRDFSTSINKKKLIIVRMENVPFLDQSGMVTLERVFRDWIKEGMAVYIIGANESVMKVLCDAKLIPNLIPTSKCFSSFGLALEHVKDLLAYQANHSQFKNDQIREEEKLNVVSNQKFKLRGTMVSGG